MRGSAPEARFLARLLALCAALAMVLPRHGTATPLFARATGQACARCHVGFSRLRPAGVAFLDRGDRPPAALQSAHARVPLTLDGAFGHTWKSSPGPSELHVIAAAPLEAPGGHPLSVFASGVVDSNRVRGDRIWLETEGLGAWHGSALRVGTFQAEMPFLSSLRRTTLAAYLTPVTIAARGAELRGVGSAGAAGAGLIESPRTVGGLRRFQDSYVWLRGTWRANDLGARLWFDRQDPNGNGLPWLQHLQYMVSGRVGLGPCQIVPAYVQDRYDDRPVIKNHDKVHSFLLEAFSPLDPAERWSATARYEHRYHTRTALTPEEDRGLEVLDLAYHLKPNAQLALEWSERSTNLERTPTRSLDAWVRVAY